jgi:hypothetical protein
MKIKTINKCIVSLKYRLLVQVCSKSQDVTAEFWKSQRDNTKVLKDFVDGNYSCKVYTFFRPNQEQLRKMQL